ncbi:MAG: OmpH family outer membrane protein [Bacteroidales bacterium]|jgi:outer membrane protein|nr:OmpH family outer membrane protein [Bacteroidales bacterium]
MKNLQVVLFALLFLAVAALFILFFTGGSKNNNTNGSGDAVPVTASDIAFVNIDTLIIKFDMFSDRRDDLMAKEQQATAELTSKGTAYERGARDYQDKVSKGLVTRATAAEMEQALMQQQEELVNLRDRLQTDLMEEEQVMNRQVLDYITSFLEENKDQYKYQYVLGKSFGSVVLYGNGALDITQQVLDGLNQKYQAEKK